MYASQVIIALAGIIYPTLCERLLSLYGFRGKCRKDKILEIYYNSFLFVVCVRYRGNRRRYKS